MKLPFERRLGATPRPDGTVEFRVWAPGADRVELELRGERHPMTDAGLGVREACVEAAAGDDYRFVADGAAHPDPCSRWQPDGLRGPSRVVDPRGFEWTDRGYDTPALEDLVIYEMHVGTFSQDGTFEGAIEHLDALAEIGINAIEVMPVNEFPGARGWGYDGGYISAVDSSYGGPEQFQAFVDAAHTRGLAVILDVVYNHVGASAKQALEAFGPYFTGKYDTFWGPAINFDDEHADGVREWVLQSAEGWIRDFHVDGLRLDAIHAIFDSSAEHLVAAVTRRVHAASHRAIVIAESGLNDPKVMRGRDRGGWGCDAAWADDFHHALRVLLTGDTEGYYEEFGKVADLAKAYHRPHIHDGGYSTFRKRRFGAPAGDLPPAAFVVFSADHDQVGNRALGDRLPLEVRPLAAFAVLLSPFTPMLWQGDEYGETAPFQFFTDHIDHEIAVATREGRRREFAAFAEFAGEEVPDPQDSETFLRSRLTRQVDRRMLDLHRDLIAWRRRLPRDEPAVADGDEAERWLRVRRGPYLLAMNFAREEREVPVAGVGELKLATGEGVSLRGEAVVLPPLSGALLR